MTKTPRVPLYVSLKAMHTLQLSDQLLERIERELTALESRLTLIDCRVTVEGAERGACRVQVQVTLPQSSWNRGRFSKPPQ